MRAGGRVLNSHDTGRFDRDSRKTFVITDERAGGRTEPANLVTACYPCNFGKAEYTLEQLALCSPRPAVVDGWDGLQSLYAALKEQTR